MGLTVLSVAYPFATVGPRAVGGAEQVLCALDRALLERGDRSLVLACEGSTCSGELVSFPAEPGLQTPDRRERTRHRVQAALDELLRRCDVDVVHLHGFDFYEYTVPDDVPVVVTLHLPIAWHPPRAWQTGSRNVHFVCVSEIQRRDCPPALEPVSVIPNGVDLPPLPASATRGDYAVVMGRICPEKNAHEALQAATRAGVRVVIAGQVFPYPEHERYFREQIQPLLEPRNNPLQHTFVGPLAPEARTALLASARCLLHPTLAAETSSLAAMEALAAGVPVIAYPSGALAEIVEHGTTGYLVRSVDEMAEALTHVAALSRVACRDAAACRFSRPAMLRSYFDLYRTVAAASRELAYA